MALPQSLSPRAARFAERMGKDGWYVFRAGEELRCPGQLKNREGAPVFVCDKYIETIEAGEVHIRPEAILPAEEERRRHSRSKARCDKCNTPLEIER